MQFLRNCKCSLSYEMTTFLYCRTEKLMLNGHDVHSVDANRMCHITELMPNKRLLQKSRAIPTLSRNGLQFLGNANADKDLQCVFRPFLQMLGNRKLPSTRPNTWTVWIISHMILHTYKTVLLSGAYCHYLLRDSNEQTVLQFIKIKNDSV